MVYPLTLLKLLELLKFSDFVKKKSEKETLSGESLEITVEWINVKFVRKKYGEKCFP